MISKASYKPHTIFLSLPVNDCLCIGIVEIKILNSLSQSKKKLREQFICLVEIRFYALYFPESMSSITSRQKIFLVSKITLAERSNGL